MRDYPFNDRVVREAFRALDQGEEMIRASHQLVTSQDLKRAAITVIAAHEAINASLDNGQLQTAVARIQEMTAPFRDPEFITAARQLREDLRNGVLAVQQVVLPTADATHQLLRDIAETVAPYSDMFRTVALWRESIAERMIAMRSRWALEAHLEISVAGFARLARLSDAVHSPQPYGEPVSDLVNGELGSGRLDDETAKPLDADSDAIAGGMNADLIAFAPNAYSEVTFSAGFRFRLTKIEPPRAIESGDPGAVFDPTHWTILVTLENALRTLVSTELRTLAGDAWIKRRVPGELRKRWVERQAEERASGRPIYHLIQYADFMDLAQLICQNDNWPSFCHIFAKRDDFRVSLERLHPIRKAIAHGRPIGRADTLVLVSEGTRVLRSLKIAQFLP
ncbi:Swt1 family HEPN domain-containing protein [Mesorhizobium sp. Cs1299R1N3]|uniref:Swt1 family HEPN domain-containing protein n=1 Tax=Mesorhizobium sp. Cs1299R1N3 TaxID=3015173 RepID=UPI00301BD572